MSGSASMWPVKYRPFIRNRLVRCLNLSKWLSFYIFRQSDNILLSTPKHIRESMKKDVKIMIVAGEASGDAHAARLCNAIKDEAGDSSVEFFGAAGPKMRAAGVKAVVRSDELAIVGVLEIGRALPMFWNAFTTLKKAAAEQKPDVAVLVDFPDFNLKLAKALKKQGIKVIYYISPQLWAWRGYRIRTIKKYVDLLLTILPFEKDWYSARGVGHVEYVGNPLAGEVHASVSKEGFCEKHDLSSEKPIVALLPGSRHKEISRILPELLATANTMLQKNGDLQFVIALANAKNLAEIDPAKKLSDISDAVFSDSFTIVTDETYDALNASDVAAVTSGTATLETGIIGTPMAIVYKGSAINYALLRPLIDVEHFGLINLIAGERIAKELIQYDLTPKILSAELFRLLEPDENARVRGELAVAKAKLGDGGTSERAAKAIISLLD